MRVMTVLLMAVAMVLIGACANANSKSAEPTNAELSQCITTLVYISSTSAPRLNIREALDQHCEGFLDPELLAEFHSPLPTRVPPQAPPTGMQPVLPLDGNR